VAPDTRRFLVAHKLETYCEDLARLGVLTYEDLLRLCEQPGAVKHLSVR
jgi:hypothetical protein